MTQNVNNNNNNTSRCAVGGVMNKKVKMFAVPHQSDSGATGHQAQSLRPLYSTENSRITHDSIIFNQCGLLAKTIIAKDYYFICRSITSLLNGRRCTELIQSALYRCLALKFLAFIVSSGKPLMNTVGAAKVETRKLKQTHL